MHKRMWGIYASYIEQFIAFKRQLGFKYQTEETIFFLFDRFTVAQGETRVGISKELAMAWTKQNLNESDSYRYHRAVCLNQLASFLNSLGICSYIIQMPPCKSTFTPYIYSTNEISSIFKACDALSAKKKYSIPSSLFFRLF